MPSLRSFFRDEVKPRLYSYVSPIINLFKLNNPAPAGLTTEILTKDLDYNSGMEYELENPDTLLQNKSKDLRFYDTLLMDDKIKSCIELKKRLVLSSGGDVIPASEEEQDQEIASFCRWQFENMRISFSDILDNYLDGQAFGFKVGEIIWANEDRMKELGKLIPDEFHGKWFVENIRHKHSVYFDFGYNDYGDVEKLYIGRNFGDNTVIEGEDLYNKFLIFTYPYPKDGNYYGDSDLKEVYPQWYAKFNIFRFRNQFLERYGMPVPTITYDSQKTSANEKNELKLMLKNFQDSMYFLIPGSWNKEAKDLIGKFKIELLEKRHANETEQYENAIDQIDKQIARKLLLPDKLGFSETTTGSYSLGETQYKIFVAVIEDLQHKIELLVNSLIKRIVDLNYFNIKDYPTYQFNKLSKHIQQEMLKILLEKGVIDKREGWIRKYVDIPTLDDKEKEEIEKKKEEDRENAPPPFQPPPPGQQPGQFPPKPNQQAKLKKKIHPLNFKAVEKHYNESEADFIRDYNLIWMDNTKWILKQLNSKDILTEGKFKEIENLNIKKTELKRLFENYFSKLYVTGRIDSIEEIDDRWKKAKKMEFKYNDLIEMQIEKEYGSITWIKTLLSQYEDLGKMTEWDGEGFKLIKARAYINAGNTEQEMLKTVGNTVMEGMRNNKTTREIAGNITKHLSDYNQKYATTIARTGASDFYNLGRMNLFTSSNVDPYVEAYQYIAILDDATTEFCASHDEQIIKKDDPQLSTINPPNHYNCRSLLSPIFINEINDPESYYYGYQDTGTKWGTGVAVEARVPARGFGG